MIDSEQIISDWIFILLLKYQRTFVEEVNLLSWDHYAEK